MWLSLVELTVRNGNKTDTVDGCRMHLSADDHKVYIQTEHGKYQYDRSEISEMTIQVRRLYQDRPDPS